jgi:hypothetical protein
MPMDGAMNRSAIDRLTDGMSRRDAAFGGGLLLASLLLSGCGSQRSVSRLPSVNFPETPLSKPPVSDSTPSKVAARPAPPVRGVTMMPRSAWASRGVANRKDTDPMGSITCLTVHHDGNRVSGMRTQSECARRIEGIRRYHVDQKGWADIGYHYIIDPMGRVWEGRPTSLQGAHVGGDMNKHNLGVMVMGNFDQQQPTGEQLATLDAFVTQQMRNYRIGLRDLRTHQEWKPTSCPGRALQAYMNRTRSRGGAIAQGMSSSMT